MPHALPASVETFPLSGESAVNWDYVTSHAQLTRLYENAKRDQWNATDTIPWTTPVDPEREIVSDLGIAIYGTPLWDAIGERKRLELRMLQGRELYEAAGLDGDQCDALGQQSELLRTFRRGIFSRIVPAVKKIGLLTPRVRDAYAALGVLEFQDNRTADEELFEQEQ